MRVKAFEDAAAGWVGAAPLNPAKKNVAGRSGMRLM